MENASLIKMNAHLINASLNEFSFPPLDLSINSSFPPFNSTQTPTMSPQEYENYIRSLYTPRYVDIIANILLFLIGAPANFKVMLLLLSNKLYANSRHHYLLFNLAIADCIVLFIMVPGEVLKLSFVTWRSNNLTCKIFQFFRVFGLYESSFVIVCISIDRYFAVVKPFKYQAMDRTIKLMIHSSWILSFIVSLPQVTSILRYGRRELLFAFCFGGR